MFWQNLGPTDQPVGDPTYQRCVAELDFADLYAPADAACASLTEAPCRASTSCQPLFVINPHAAGPHFERCLGLVTGTGGPSASCPQDHLSCRARPDCAPMFMQEVGPNDGAVGDPYYLRCDVEASVETPDPS